MTAARPLADEASALPSFVIIGAAKAGTTALYWYLADHPQVFMSPVKETNFFAFGLDDEGNRLYGDPDLHRFPVQTAAAYEELFSGAGEALAVGEASPIYLECPQSAARIHEALPTARIICGLREPVDRAYSDYLMYLRARGRRLDPTHDLTASSTWARPDSHWMQISRYHEALSRYFDLFPREQIHVFLFEDLKADTLGSVRDDLPSRRGLPGLRPRPRDAAQHRRHAVEPNAREGLHERLRQEGGRAVDPEKGGGHGETPPYEESEEGPFTPRGVEGRAGPALPRRHREDLGADQKEPGPLAPAGLSGLDGSGSFTATRIPADGWCSRRRRRSFAGLARGASAATTDPR